MAPSRGVRTAVLALFFLSGVSGLVYEVVWTRYLTLFLGHTARGNAVVLATFMGGLALGYRRFGAVADRLARRPDGARSLLGLYGALEAAIGLYGFAFPWLMAAASRGYLALGTRLGPDAPALLPLSLAIAAATLLLPTFLMGGTLPLLVTWAASARASETGGAVARFYAVNSAGAVVGAVAAGFFLVERLGQRATVETAGALNLMLALVAVLLALLSASRPAEPLEETAPDARPDDSIEPCPRWLPPLAALLSGLAALLLEVVWIRLFGVVFGSSTQSFTAIVAAFVTGITLGAGFARRLLASSRIRPLTLLAVAAITGALLVVAAEPAYGWLPYLLGRLRMHYGADHQFLRFQAAKFYLSFVVMVAPTAISGLILPLAAHLGSRRAGRTGRDVGRVFAANAVGSVLGAALAGTVLVPWLSLRGALLAGVMVLLLVGLVTALALPPRPRLLLSLAALGVVPLALLAARWDLRALSSGEFRRNSALGSHDRWLAEQAHATLDFHEDGQVSTVDVLSLPDGKRYLKVNGKTDASSWGDVLTAAASPAVGAILADGVAGGGARVGRGLVIGFGSGVTANALLKFGLDVDLVEIEPAVLHAAPHFADLNDDCLDDPHLTTHVADARAFLAMAPDLYDVIVNEPSNPWVAGVASLFTREFFQAARARLAPGGSFVQWFHLYDMDDETVRLVLRTVGGTFRYVTVWSFENDIAIVARETPIDHDLARIAARFDRPAVRDLFTRAGVYDLFALLSTQLASEEGFRRLLDDGALHEDDLPTLEYHAPRAQFDRSYSFVLSGYDERRRFDPRLSPLLLGDYLRDHGRAAASEAIDFTVLQAGEPRTPDAFRFRYLDAALSSCREPGTLGKLAVDLERDHRSSEADRTLAALTKLEPASARSDFVRAEVELHRAGARATTDAALIAALRSCASRPPDHYRDACLRIARGAGITLE